MRVLLVNTNRMQPPIAPIGLDYLADALVAEGHRPALADLCFAADPPHEIIRQLRAQTPDLVGVTIRNTDDCYFTGGANFLPELRDVVRQIRQETQVPVVLGGVGFSVSPRAALEYCAADFGIAGEGELALNALLRELAGARRFDQVPNLVYREAGRIRLNAAVDADLARLPARRRNLVDNVRYYRAGGQAGFETRRGCNQACVYCADPVAKGRTIRLRPPALVAEELAGLHARGIDHFHTCDSEFNLPRHHAEAVCQAILDTGLADRIRWYAYCAPAPFDDALAALFRRAGCAGIDFGVDSASDAILRALGRSFTRDDLARTAEVCRRHALPFMYDLLLGGPGETAETVRETIAFLRRIEPDCVGVSMGVRVYAGTPLARQLAGEGGPEAAAARHGAWEGAPDFLAPAYYLSPALGTGLLDCVREAVGGDRRFFLPEDHPGGENYNYNGNDALVRAIAQGARGAFWDILRRA